LNITKFADLTWCSPPKPLNLEKDEVHVWRSSLVDTAFRVQSLLQVLAPEERKRAERFCFQKHRQKYIVARGLLRTILSHYLGLEPSKLEFCHNLYGKPALTKDLGGETLKFNLSHSHDIVLYAITLSRDVGVDIEHIRSGFSYEEIAKQFFTPREFAALCALPLTKQQESFFDYWTYKEAFIKARGEGLTLNLDQFDVSFTPGEQATILNIESEPQEAARWSVQKLAPGSGHVAALAVEGHDWQLKCWQWLE
jgi:4'-phosphopantetheinyl transferase